MDKRMFGVLPPAWRWLPRVAATAALAAGLATLAILGGCATRPAAEPPQAERLLRDELFSPNRDVIDPAQVMALSPAMRAFIRDRLPGSSMRMGDGRQVLLDSLYIRGELRLEYDAEMTRNAAEAFDARAGNCLSLTLMTAAFARELGMPVVFRHIYAEEQWSRVGDLQVMSGHVNIALGRRPTDFKVLGEDEPTLVVDFLPGVQIRRQRAMSLDERTVVAMYLNNRAAELMAQGLLDRAYWWARAAWQHDPRLLNALNTLGVIYRRHGDVAPAEAAFRAVLAQEPGNTQAMANLAQVLKATGQLAEAGQWEARLAQLQPYPPFKFFDLGVAAMQRGDYREARDLFTREVERAAYYHEFHFWLALAHVGLGNWAEVRRELALAKDVSTTEKSRQLYAAKLASLKAAQR